MSQIWTFSPSSEPLLQRCIEAAMIQNVDNKWTKNFGCKTSTQSNISVLTEKKTALNTQETTPSPIEEKTEEITENYDEFFDNLEIQIRIDLVMNKCAENPQLLRKMAQRLPSNTTEKLFKLIFASKDLDNSFLISIFHKFLPLYIKLQYSWICIDILTEISVRYPEMFQSLIKILLEDVEMPNQVVNNFLSTLDEKKLTKFFENFSKIEMSTESFTHNITIICTSYKDCIKTEKIQNWVQMNLCKHSKGCYSNKNYGRLFLAYLQTEKSLGHTVSRQLAECLEEHQSPFKRPCSILLHELIE